MASLILFVLGFIGKALLSMKLWHLLLAAAIVGLGYLAWRLLRRRTSVRYTNSYLTPEMKAAAYAASPEWARSLFDLFAADPSDCVVASAPEPSASAPTAQATKARAKSSFERIGHEEFRAIVERYGGDPSLVRENVRLSHIRNPETNRCLEFDSYYSEGPHSIAIEYQGVQHSVYPNPFHRTRADFDAQVRRDRVKAAVAQASGIHLISVPYYVDRCIKDDSEPSGWRFDESISETDRRTRIANYILERLTEYYSSRFGRRGIRARPTPPPAADSEDIHA